MGTKPGIALIGVVLTGIMLSGCESSTPYRAGKPWGQMSAAQTANSNAYPAAAWGTQARSTTGLTPGAPGSTLNAASSQPTSPASPTGMAPAGSQTSASFPGMPLSQTATGSVDQGSRMTIPGSAPAPATQASPSGTPAAGGTGMKAPEVPPANTSQSRESSYQTRYPQLQPSDGVPTMPKSGQSPNE